MEDLHYQAPVYELSVEGSHDYFANGLLVHNCDEVAAWSKLIAIDTWDMMQFGLRLGKNPRALWTSTPKPVALIRRLVKEKHAVIIGGSTYENKANLAANFFRQVSQYEGTKLGRQELSGELIDLEEGGIIARKEWQLWPAAKQFPLFQFVIMSLDTAFTEKTLDKKTHDADPTASQVWGVFSMEGKLNVMMLDAWRDYLGFPELIKRVKRERKFTYGETDQPMIKTYLSQQGGLRRGRSPDIILIEDKGSGISLRQQLAAEDILATPYNPKRMDKTARLHAASPVFAHMRVWVPESKVREGEPMTWAEPVVAAVCSFKGPGSIPHDDDVDACSQALIYIKDNLLGQLDDPPPPENLAARASNDVQSNPYAQ